MRKSAIALNPHHTPTNMTGLRMPFSKRRSTMWYTVLTGGTLALLYTILNQYNGVRRFQRKSTFTIEPADEQEREMLDQIRRYTTQLPNSTEVTIVSAYFNIGVVKGKTSKGRGPDQYYQWMTTFEWLDNPLIVFADTDETVAYFQTLRARYAPSRTTIIKLSREELWSFRTADQIEAIFSQPDYPVQVQSLYCCAMNAKFELLEKVLRENLYHTKYIAWLDIGLFRAEVGKEEIIHLTVPTDFKPDSVAYSEVMPLQNDTDVAEIFSTTRKVWVGGASFLATPEVMYVWCREYQRAVQKLLDMKWMHTDQRIIYCMVQPSFHFGLRVPIQAYTRHPANIWFSVAYLMKEAP